jgi:RNA polymerase sigma-70 factor, ECF subfamily
MQTSGAVSSELDGDGPDSEGWGTSDADRLQRYLFRRFRRPLLHYVLSLVNGDYSFAEDVVQETMLRAWLHIDELEAARAGPWLYQVAHNIAISAFYRKREARPREVPIVQDTFPVMDRDFDRAVDATYLRTALLELSYEHREAVVQLYYLQRSVAEVAALLDIPAGTVRSRAFYALRELRLVLERRGVTH